MEKDMQTRRHFLLSASALTALAASGQRALAAFEITTARRSGKPS
jgi:hypothetical protein